MGFRKLEYLVAAQAQMPQTLTIGGDGSVCYLSFTNKEAMDRPEIGVYEMALPDAQMESLRTALARSPVSDWSDHWGRVFSGDRYQRLRVVEGSTTVEKMVGSNEPVAPPLNGFLDRLDQIVGQVVQHPVQVLRLDLEQPAVVAEGQLRLVLALSNRGTQTLYARHPGNLVEAEDGNLAAKVWPDKHVSQLAPEDIIAVSLAKVEEFDTEGGAQTGTVVLEIPPRARVRFKAEGRIELAKGGDYVVRLTYFSPLQRTRLGRELIAGEILTVTQKVRVAEATKAPAR